MRKIILVINICIAFLSCNKITYKNDNCAEAHIDKIYAIQDPIEYSSLKSSLSDFWSEGELLGLFSYSGASSSQNSSQLAFKVAYVDDEVVAYSRSTGWALVPDSHYKYIMNFPYSRENTRGQIRIDFTGQIQLENNSLAGCHSYDYLYSDAVTPTSESPVTFNLHHIGSLVNINITVPEKYESTTFYRMKLFADSKAFIYGGSYSVDDIVQEGRPVFEKQVCDGLKLSFGQEGIKPKDGVISAWLMMFPSDVQDMPLTVKLYAGNNNVPTLSGTFTPEKNQKAGEEYTYSVSTTKVDVLLPDRPAEDEKYQILLFGHSFGVDCTQMLSSLIYDAGISNVHLGRFVHGSAYLATHWGHILKGDEYQYDDMKAGQTNWTVYGRKAEDILKKYPWDIIIFQNSNGSDGEGNYATYQPYLDSLTNYVTRVCTKAHGKTPVIGWNMFWGYQEGSAYDRNAVSRYNLNVEAAKQMMADTEIRLIVASGTGVQNARETSLNDPGSPEKPSTTNYLTRDGFHASYGICRYVAAATWYQTLIAPIYGIDITGNTYRPTGYSFEGDKVDDHAAAILQKCAVEAVKHPFEVTLIEE